MEPATPVLKTPAPGFFRDREKVPLGDYGNSPLTIAQKSALHSELIRKRDNLHMTSQQKLSMYRTKISTLPKGAAATLGRSGPVDVGTCLLTSTQAQDLHTDVGFRKKLTTNIPDLSATNNNNGLRFQRKQGVTNHNPQDGGTQYVSNVCTGNWVEEQRDSDWKSGYHQQELGLKKLYMSEATRRFAPPTEEYYNKVMEASPVAQFPPVKREKVVVRDSKPGGALIYSSRGFGTGYGMDRTSEHSKGGYWVGTAPARNFETSTMTANTGGSFEYQKRNRQYDPKAKILGGTRGLDMTNSRMANTVRNLQASQRWTSRWQTSSSVDFVDRSKQMRASTTSLVDRQASPAASVSVRPLTGEL